MSSHTRMRQVLALNLLGYKLGLEFSQDAPLDLSIIVERLMPKNARFLEEDIQKYMGGIIGYTFGERSFEEVTKEADYSSANFNDFVWRLLVALQVAEGFTVNTNLLDRIKKVLGNIDVKDKEALLFSSAFLPACLAHSLKIGN